MAVKKKKPVATTTTGNSKTSSNRQPKNSKKIKAGTKLHSVISYLADGNRLDRFKAERICHDHVLNSTISGFEREYGVIVNRSPIQVPGYKGSLVNCAEYWLSRTEQRKAKALLQ